MQTAKTLNPYLARLLLNPDFQKYQAALENHRLALFEKGEADSTLESFLEKKGQRKMLKQLLDRGSLDAFFRDNSK